MSEFLKLARRFGRDDSGVFAVVFGVMAIVLVALGGAVVDYITLEQTRSRAQTALDAAVLALQPEILKASYNKQTITDNAEKFLIERIGDDRITASIEDTVISVDDGLLYFRAEVRMPTMFVSLVGVPSLSARVESEAVRKKLALEVVMVLDNSGSMKDENRMSRLVDAAKCATYILMYDAVVDAGIDHEGNSNTCVPAPDAVPVEDVRIGIVPFTMFVNVGPTNANATWMDRIGASSIHYDNFDNDDDEDRLVTSMTSPNYAFPTRQTLFAATREDWRGCVVARPHTKSDALPTRYLDTDDTPPTSGDTLFVPMFSPDMASDTGGNNYLSDSPSICDRPAHGNTQCVITEQRNYSSRNGWSGASVSKREARGPTDFVSSDLYPNAFYGRHANSCSCRNSTTTSGWTTDPNNSNRQTRTVTCKGYIPQELSPRELQERVCKYYAGVGDTEFSKGPNADCTRTPILPLTKNTTSVIATIDDMRAEGGTNIHEGAVWGYRVLSPGEPFTQGGPYDDATSKVMIIMTDGENTDYNLPTTRYQNGYCNQAMVDLNGKCFNTAYGFPYNSNNNKAASTSGGTIELLGRLNSPSNTGAVGVSNASLVTEMNTRTAQTCANADSAGIKIYTIGLATDKVSQSTESVVRAMLTNCASTPNHARFPDKSSELKSTFESIANELTSLRLTR